MKTDSLPNTSTWEPQLGAFTTGNLKVTLSPLGRLDIFATSNAAAGDTLTIQLRKGGKLTGVPIDPGCTMALDGRAVSFVTINGADSGVIWAIVPQDAPPTWGDSSRDVQGGVALIDHAEFSANLAAGTADAVVAGPGSTIPKSTLVRFTLGYAGPVITAADPNCYIRIIGSTSGNVYATCPAGGAYSGSFRMPQGEQLQANSRNQDTIGHFTSASWNAWSGE